MSIFISIIIPVYNVEKYLEQCIDSVLNHSFNNFEVILINDGSTDSSGVICDQYAGKDARVKVFHKTNEGVSSARNLGIENAKGDYIWFIDGDDKIAENALQILKENIKPNLDVLSFNFTYFNLQENQKQANPKKEVLGIVNGGIFLKGDFRFSACTFIYRRKIVLENTICFIPQITHFEDNLFNIEVFNQAESVIQIKEYLYLYRQNRENSAMNNSNYKVYCEAIIKILRHLKKVKINVISAERFELIKLNFWSSFIFYFYNSSSYNHEEILILSKKFYGSCGKIKFNRSLKAFQCQDLLFYTLFTKKTLLILQRADYKFVRKTLNKIF